MARFFLIPRSSALMITFLLSACTTTEFEPAEYGNMTDTFFLEAIGKMMTSDGHPICNSLNLKKYLGFNYDHINEKQTWNGRIINSSVAINLSDPSKKRQLYSGSQVASEAESPLACRITIQFSEERFCAIPPSTIANLIEAREINSGEPALHGPNWFPTLLFIPHKERQGIRIIFFTTPSKCIRGFNITSEYGK